MVEAIDRGDIALPDIQRPFVWQATKVRSLFDSMYKGFPVGFLLFWKTDADPGARQIGTGKTAPQYLIVDGQQRLTSLYAVMKGIEVLREDYSRTRIRIAFRPADGTFAVTDAAIEKDPEFLPDISVLWAPRSFWQAIRGFITRLATKREVDQEERDRLEEALHRLHDLSGYLFKVVELSQAVNEEQVAEIFVRINSEGVTLNQADFILTLMSVFWEKGRRELEDFCRAAKTPALGTASPFNWYIQPQPPQLLRVTVALAFRRAVLKNVYTVLRGRDLESGSASPQSRETQFETLEAAQAHVLNLTHWHEFLLCLERAGFRGSKMISSENAILFSYALWLFGRVHYDVQIPQLREVIARWFFMTHATSRYSGAFESQAERDFALLGGVAPGDAQGFCDALNRLIDDTLTNDFWTITLPNNLATSAAKSPALMAYIAALNIHDAPALLSRVRVRARLDPAVTVRKGIERHHLFPRKYLRGALGLTEASKINQIANMALVEWYDNIAISDKAPSDYWPAEVAEAHLPPTELAKHTYMHALPNDWHKMDYQAFLSARRHLMAHVTKDAFNLLGQHSYQPDYPVPGEPDTVPAPAGVFGAKLSHLIDLDLLDVGATLVDLQHGTDASAVVTAEGKIELEGQIFETPTGAACAVLDVKQCDGWAFWYTGTDKGLKPLADLREEFVRRLTQPEAPA
ncbi:GmrSD restriction endonuclease domain-containing protein [Nonomuraea bangladeshensis]|uniref:GmrSD restriction endonuclease domain-containing protein n=1 Tax=Nonomuraea bangladeshensis TaxID=404385 RepID=UPI0031E10730